MTFQEGTSEYYKNYYISKNGEFAVGISDYLFRMKCLQILHKSNNNFYVVQEYRGYDLKKLGSLYYEIIEIFKIIDNNLKGENWKVVFDKLPVKKQKYFDYENYDFYYK